MESERPRGDLLGGKIEREERRSTFLHIGVDCHVLRIDLDQRAVIVASDCRIGAGQGPEKGKRAPAKDFRKDVGDVSRIARRDGDVVKHRPLLRASMVIGFDRRSRQTYATKVA